MQKVSGLRVKGFSTHFQQLYFRYTGERETLERTLSGIEGLLVQTLEADTPVQSDLGRTLQQQPTTISEPYKSRDRKSDDTYTVGQDSGDEADEKKEQHHEDT